MDKMPRFEEMRAATVEFSDPASVPSVKPPASLFSRYVGWSLLLSVLMLVLGLGWIAIRAGATRPTRFAYPTDDSYINLAMSRNLAQSGTWGINPGEFGPAASSPLWTLLVAAAIKVLGSREWILTVLATGCGMGLLFFVDRIGRREAWPAHVRAGILALMLLVMPLIPMCVLGMEHVLHTLLTLWVLDLVWRLPSRGQPVTGAYVLSLLTACLLTTASRFEGLFLAAAFALILVLQRRWWLAFGVLATAALPVALHGAVSLANGWGWLPSSVRLKGNIPNATSWFHRLCAMGAHVYQTYVVGNALMAHLIGAFLAPLIALVIMRRSPARRPAARLTCVFVLTFVQHLALAGTGWFYRYEAYLMASQVLVLGYLLGPALPRRLPEWSLWRQATPALEALALVSLLVLPQLLRGLHAFRETPHAMKNIYDQQCQMASFVRRYYSGSVVAANDIGALCFAGQARVLDLMGLGHRGMFLARLDGSYGRAYLERTCASEKVEIALVYDAWFEGGRALPASWQRVGTLAIEHNVGCANELVSFYAVAPGAAPKLAQSLQDFKAHTPADVHIALEKK